jgi:hypothetical protein
MRADVAAIRHNGPVTTLLSPYSTYHLLKQQEDQEIAIFRSSLLLVAISPPFPYQIKSLAAIQVLSGGNNVVIRPNYRKRVPG